MKNQFILLIVLMSGSLYSQVGINTETPKATLDVVASPEISTRVDGLIAPRLEGNELSAKDALYTADQTGAIVYAKSAASPTTARTVNVTAEGYYYFDGEIWQKFLQEPWKIQNTNTEASQNTQNIYQNAKVAIGTIATDNVSDKQLDVKGDFRTQNINENGVMNLLETNSTMLPDATVLISTDNEDLSLATKYSAFFAQPASVSTDVSDVNTGLGTSQMILPSTGVFRSTDGNNGTGAGLDVMSQGSAFLSAYNDTSGYQSSIGVSPQTASLIVEKPDTGEAASFGVNTYGLWFNFKNSASDIKGAYQFPSNYGKRGQVLTTHGAPNDPGNMGIANNLTWRDVADLIILKSPNGNCYKLNVSDTGILSTTPDADCTVDSYNPSMYAKMDNQGKTSAHLSENKILDMLQSQKKMLEDQNKVIEQLKLKINDLTKK